MLTQENESCDGEQVETSPFNGECGIWEQHGREVNAGSLQKVNVLAEVIGEGIDLSRVHSTGKPDWLGHTNPSSRKAISLIKPLSLYKTPYSYANYAPFFCATFFYLSQTKGHFFPSVSDIFKMHLFVLEKQYCRH